MKNILVGLFGGFTYSLKPECGMLDMPLIMHRDLYGAPRLCFTVLNICRIGRRTFIYVMMSRKYAKLAIFTFFWWTYSLMHSGRSHIYTVVYFAHYRSRRQQAVTFRARYTESALLACLHSIQSSVAWIDRLVLVPAQRACACHTCPFHVRAKNPHRKGHFAKQLCLCTLSTPPLCALKRRKVWDD